MFEIKIKSKLSEGENYCNQLLQAFFYLPDLFLFLGLFSVAMRDLANIANNSPKWIVLDGDIDPMWIESLNTVMDDNKVKIESLAHA